MRQNFLVNSLRTSLDHNLSIFLQSDRISSVKIRIHAESDFLWALHKTKSNNGVSSRFMLTLAVASLTSTVSWFDHFSNFVHATCSTSGSIFLRLSGPNRLSTMFFRYLYINPCSEPTFCRPNISVKVSGYQLWNKCPSCWKM